MRILLSLATSCTTAFSQSTINSTNKYAWGANIGWINCRDSNETIQGLRLTEYTCAGFLWSANCGWINFGNSTPANGIHFANTDASDFGVNHDGTGRLRGLAWGANIGWLNFEDTGNPRINLTNGQLSGFAWGANVGWINLGNTTAYVQTDAILNNRDGDKDGITDAWELQHTGDIETLSEIGDADGDGESDLAEYLADTDPMDPNDHLRITAYSVELLATADSTVTWTSRPTRFYRIESSDKLTKPWQLTLDAIPPTGLLTARDVRTPLSLQGFLRVSSYRPLAP